MLFADLWFGLFLLFGGVGILRLALRGTWVVREVFLLLGWRSGRGKSLADVVVAICGR